jgi:energy-coupling factor transporter ATP-binding protein EcfA2
MLIKSWSVDQSKENVFLYLQNGTFRAEVHKNGKVKQIGKEWIVGVPKEVSKNITALNAYVKDSYITLKTLSDGSFKLYINSRMRGGVITEEKSSSRLDRNILKNLEKAIDEAKKAKGKKIIALIGNTGCGKSTAINYFLDSELIYDKKSKTISVKDKTTEFAKIGHSKTDSETLYANIYEKENSPYIFADCGGFLDTRKDQDIVVSSSIKLTLENASEVKLVICCDYSIPEADRAIYFSGMIRTVLYSLLKKYSNHRGAVHLMFTKPKMIEESFQGKDEIIELLYKIRDSKHKNGSEWELYDFLLRDKGKYISVCNPRIKEEREEHLNNFDDMSPITNCDEAFQIPYSALSEKKLKEELTAISVGGTGLYSTYFSNIDTINRLKKDIQHLENKISSINDSIKIIGDGKGDADTIKQENEKIILQNNEIIKEQKKQILSYEKARKEIEVEIKKIQEYIKLANDEGKKVEEYWSDDIDQEAWLIETKNRTTTTHETDEPWYKFKSDSKTTTVSESSTYDARAIEKNFNYKGPKIQKIVKTPSDDKCWSEEKESDNSYFIKYTSGKGEPAKASVKIFVEKKYFPEHIYQLSGYDTEINIQLSNKNKTIESISKCKEVMFQAESMLQSKGTILEKIEDYKNSIKEFEKTKNKYIEELNSTLKNNVLIDKDIEENKEDFQFVFDYKSLSRDEKLDTDIIKKFEEQSKLYADHKKNGINGTDEYSKKYKASFKDTSYTSSENINKTTNPILEYEGDIWEKKDTTADGSCSIHALLGDEFDGVYIFRSGPEAKKYFIERFQAVYKEGLHRVHFFEVLVDYIGLYHGLVLEGETYQSSEAASLFKDNSIGNKIYLEAVEKGYLTSEEDFKKGKSKSVDPKVITLLENDELINAYVEAVQKPAYFLSDLEINLAAYVFDLKVLFFREGGLPVLYNKNGKKSVAISHEGLHYSRCEKKEKK